MEPQDAFAIKVRKAIDDDLEDASTDMVQRHAAYNTAFEQLIDYYPMHRPVLAATKAAYTSCLDSLKQLHQANELTHSKAREQGCNTANCFLYRRRNEELHDALSTLRKNNDVLRSRLVKLRERKSETEARIAFLQEGGIESASEEFRLVNGMPENVHLSKLRKLFTVQQLSDPVFLEKTLSQLKERIDQLNEAKGGQKYVEKTEVERARSRLQDNLERRDQLIEHNYKLWYKLNRLRCVLQSLREAAAQAAPIGDYTLGKSAALAETQDRNKSATRFDVVNTVMQNAQLLRDVPQPQGDVTARQNTEVLCRSENSMEDQLSEATERILEYIDQYNLMMKRGEYWKAALHAASSPKGVLKNIPTLRRFEEAWDSSKVLTRARNLNKSVEFDEQEVPAVLYIEAVLNDTFLNGYEEADTSMELFAAECVRAALRFGRADLAVLSVSGGRVPSCAPVADVLFEHAKEMRAAVENERTPRAANEAIGSLRPVSSFELELLDLAYRLYSSGKVAVRSRALECLLGCRKFQDAIAYAQQFKLEGKLCEMAFASQSPDFELSVLLVRNGLIAMEECLNVMVTQWHRHELAALVANAVFKSRNQNLRSSWISLASNALDLEVLTRLVRTKAFREQVAANDVEFGYSCMASAIVQHSIRSACEVVANDADEDTTTAPSDDTSSNASLTDDANDVNWDIFKRLASINIKPDSQTT